MVRMMPFLSVLVALVPLGVGAAESNNSYSNEVAKWRQHREAVLRADDGWPHRHRPVLVASGGEPGLVRIHPTMCCCLKDQRAATWAP